MRTLRDEWRRMTDAMWQHLYTNQFFSKYGDYRVVEGELVWAGVYRGEQMERLRDRVCVEVPDESGSHYVHIGRIGDNVKLILPPEEKEPADKVMLRLMAAKEEALQREAIERLRADRYEKALREIAQIRMAGTRANRKRMLRETPLAWLCKAEWLAEEVLDDTD